MARRPMDAREAAERAFKAVTTKPAEPLPKAAAPLPSPGAARGAAPAVPNAREQVSLRLDRAVLDHFQAGGPGWQERINTALRKAAGL